MSVFEVTPVMVLIDEVEIETGVIVASEVLSSVLSAEGFVVGPPFGCDPLGDDGVKASADRPVVAPVSVPVGEEFGGIKVPWEGHTDEKKSQDGVTVTVTVTVSLLSRGNP